MRSPKVKEVVLEALETRESMYGGSRDLLFIGGLGRGRPIHVSALEGWTRRQEKTLDMDINTTRPRLRKKKLKR